MKINFKLVISAALLATNVYGAQAPKQAPKKIVTYVSPKLDINYTSLAIGDKGILTIEPALQDQLQKEIGQKSMEWIYALMVQEKSPAKILAMHRNSHALKDVVARYSAVLSTDSVAVNK